jgi:hypothetical protein
MYFSKFSALSVAIFSLAAQVQAAPLTSNTLLKRADLCASEGRVYYAQGQCSSGFVGCAPANSERVCGGELQYRSDCGHPAFNLGDWYVCPNNGFVGCHTIDACALDGGNKDNGTPAPPTPPNQNEPATGGGPSCPPGTNYFGEGVCPSGFLGCHADGGQVCPGARRFYPGDCPAGSGVFQRCANGFAGCSTNPNMCG